MPGRFRKGLLFFALALLVLLGACKPQATATTTTMATTTTAVTYSLPELEYRLFAQYDVFWCDPDFYPVARPGSELGNAIAQFPAIQANATEFSAILNYLSLDQKDSYTDEEKLLIYRQHKKLTFVVQMTASGVSCDFILRVGQGQGWRYEGTVTASGKITITSQVVSFNTCPICLTKGTLIDTPSGLVPVEQLKQGMAVWMQDEAGNRVAASIIRTLSTQVPQSFMVVKIALEDGRTVSASPGHPSADRKALGDYRVGDILDGSRVISAGSVAYSEGATYDILPAGGTGLYWADGILLLSTLE